MKKPSLLALLLAMLFGVFLVPGAARADGPGDTVAEENKTSSVPKATTSGQPGAESSPRSSNRSGEAGGTPSGARTGVSVPRVMLKSLATAPQSVPAGGSFTLSFSLVNMSKKARVNNLKVSLSQAEGAFLPAEGSSSLYVPTIKAGGTNEQKMTFHALPTLENRPYAMTLTVEYEDTESNAFSTSETISVMVAQPSRADVSSSTVSPESVIPGQEAIATFSVNNLGKTKLYNTRVSVAEGQGVEARDQFIGSIEPGAAGNVELSLIGTVEHAGPVKAVITYEDEFGNATILEKEINLTVNPVPAPQQSNPESVSPPEQEEKGIVVEPWVYWVGGAVVVGIAALIVTISLLRRRSRREKTSDPDLLDNDPLVDLGR
ncbi:hypothetical protein [Arachnia propionica]|uniref:hypothetical protein n=1 Tax=Arachnia propionica TaxID=1750 RepID=UPI000F6CADB4|nr:hypothetical protein [Arachnia propionica]VEJ59207.1 Uncharacterised protein [Arachnia propionica]